jgi:3-methyladenine DNA glycosylase AlkC
MSTHASQPDFRRLYEQAFTEFGTMALWSSRPVPNPTPADALAITHSLRVEGNLEARRLAEEIEQACYAAL